jgi:hypothetical protein
MIGCKLAEDNTFMGWLGGGVAGLSVNKALSATALFSWALKPLSAPRYKLIKISVE